jgi:hypothetical protein
VASFYEYICHNGKSILLHPWTFLASKNGPSVMITSYLPYVECLAISPDLVKDDIDDATAGSSTSDIIDWKKTQEKDTRLQYWRKMVETGQKPEKEDTIIRIFCCPPLDGSKVR